MNRITGLSGTHTEGLLFGKGLGNTETNLNWAEIADFAQKYGGKIIGLLSKQPQTVSGSWYKGVIDNVPWRKAVMDGIRNGTSFNIEDAKRLYNWHIGPTGYYGGLMKDKEDGKLIGYNQTRESIITSVKTTLEAALGYINSGAANLPNTNMPLATTNNSNVNRTNVQANTAGFSLGPIKNIIIPVAALGFIGTLAYTAFKNGGSLLPKKSNQKEFNV